MKENNRLKQIFGRTDGNCHLCGSGLCFSNYAAHGRRGAWEVEHSLPKASGGTDHLKNLYPAHISCNRSKGSKSTRSARAKNGRSAAPRSAAKKQSITKENMLRSASAGAALGVVFGGPPGALAGALLGALIGGNMNPESQ